MPARIVFLEKQFHELRDYVFDRPGVEGAAFILCGQSRSECSNKLIAHAVMPIADEDYARREPYGLTITSRALARITKLARYEGLSIVFAHSHPGGIPEFSEQDDREEAKLIPFLQSRVPDRIHGTVVLTEDSIAGRLFCPGCVPTNGVLTIGDRIRAWSPALGADIQQIFDRQVRAFGNDIQRILRVLHVSVVGLGGTGSSLAEQLYRLGVGILTLFDGDKLESTNINRVYGSGMRDVGEHKVVIAKRHLDRIGLDTKVNIVPDHITYEHAAKSLRDCDIVFGCTDKQLPRAILTKLALQYSIPVLDLGVLIDSDAGQIQGVHGRVTTLMPGEACLFCRGRISPEAIRIEALSKVDRIKQTQEGYAPELGDPAPAVIPFTSAVASAAVSELLHRLTGFMGSERHSSEIMLVFDENRIRTNRVSPRANCLCSDPSTWGRGDEQPFLGMAWPNHTR